MAQQNRNPYSWQRAWIGAVVSLILGTTIVLVIVLATGEIDRTWLASLATALVLLTLFAGLIEYARYRIHEDRRQ
jgi:hypothetical protein